MHRGGGVDAETPASSKKTRWRQHDHRLRDLPGLKKFRATLSRHTKFKCAMAQAYISSWKLQTKTADSGNLNKKFFSRHRPTATSNQYINTRENCGRHKLPPGNYAIVPTTFEPNEEADFVLRIHTEKESSMM